MTREESLKVATRAIVVSNIFQLADPYYLLSRTEWQRDVLRDEFRQAIGALRRLTEMIDASGTIFAGDMRATVEELLAIARAAGIEEAG